MLCLSAAVVQAQIPDGEWHAGIRINDSLDLPFTFTSANGIINIHNADENITVDEISFNDDSVFIRMPVFDAEFRCRINEGRLDGRFLNHARRDNNVFEFHAEKGIGYRFSDRPERSSKDITGRYAVIFDGEDDLSKNAVAEFSQSGSRITGTFLTVTGDYRYLDGELSGKNLRLSAFDGSHLFLFTAIIKGDSIVDGHYFSGSHWHDTWRGVKNDTAHLPEADRLIPFSNEVLEFNFPDKDGKVVSLNDANYKEKPVIIQLMGTWCPNCMDETAFLSQWYNKSHKNIELIALDFERITDTAVVHRNIERLIKKYKINYEILFAGSNDKSEASAKLGMNKIIAFPTLIFLNKKKQIIRVHSGFSGPATGIEYEKFKIWFSNAVDAQQ